MTSRGLSTCQRAVNEMESTLRASRENSAGSAIGLGGVWGEGGAEGSDGYQVSV